MVAGRGWVAVTRDGRIRYSPLALTALMDSGACLFVIVGKLNAEETSSVFLRYRKKVERLAAAEKAAFIAKIRRDGVKMWLRHKTWTRGC